MIKPFMKLLLNQSGFSCSIQFWWLIVNPFFSVNSEFLHIHIQHSEDNATNVNVGTHELDFHKEINKGCDLIVNENISHYYQIA